MYTISCIICFLSSPNQFLYNMHYLCELLLFNNYGERLVLSAFDEQKMHVPKNSFRLAPLCRRVLRAFNTARIVRYLHIHRLLTSCTAGPVSGLSRTGEHTTSSGPLIPYNIHIVRCVRTRFLYNGNSKQLYLRVTVDIKK